MKESILLVLRAAFVAPLGFTRNNPFLVLGAFGTLVLLDIAPGLLARLDPFGFPSALYERLFLFIVFVATGIWLVFMVGAYRRILGRGPARPHYIFFFVVTLVLVQNLSHILTIAIAPLGFWIWKIIDAFLLLLALPLLAALIEPAPQLGAALRRYIQHLGLLAVGLLAILLFYQGLTLFAQSLPPGPDGAPAAQIFWMQAALWTEWTIRHLQPFHLALALPLMLARMEDH